MVPLDIFSMLYQGIPEGCGFLRPQTLTQKTATVSTAGPFTFEQLLGDFMLETMEFIIQNLGVSITQFPMNQYLDFNNGWLVGPVILGQAKLKADGAQKLRWTPGAKDSRFSLHCEAKFGNSLEPFSMLIATRDGESMLNYSKMVTTQPKVRKTHIVFWNQSEKPLASLNG